ncbi:hypothetical protein T12_16932 [Trichinella patagoniensis]|uniref:Uncharacterized protein n=1 Tax=Trichinella patagoniensis TaxID=990121 RepID=A0A0V0ZFP1_9BILA|nr:hypothetical protein T12_16932 [Trichinella patagoniensis]
MALTITLQSLTALGSLGGKSINAVQLFSTLYNSNLRSTVTEVVRCILVVMETWLQNGLCCVGGL